jgi:predicted dehydrogenase
MDEKIGLAVIGLGVIGRRMLEQTALRKDFDVVGAWDIDPQATSRAAADFPAARTSASAEAAIADPRTEVVYVGTPPAHHRHYALLAARHGKRVFCEKPLAIDVAEGRRLVDELAAAGTPNAVNFVYASAPAATELARRIAAGEIGEVTGAEVALFFSRWPRDWQANAQWLRWRAEGGFTREVLSHFVYLAGRLFGDCRFVSGSVDYPADGRSCERASLGRFDCAGIPMLAGASAGGAGPDEVRFTVRGTRGALRLENWYEMSCSDGARWATVPLPIAPFPDMRTAAYQAQLDSLHRFARGQPSPLPDAALALRVQQAIEALLQSDGAPLSPRAA